MKTYESHRIIEAIKELDIEDTLLWDDSDGKVYVVKLEKKYPKDWKEDDLK